ncbi:hypothetical protein FBQ99_14830 [Chloroflexi bacterium CFX2]|nr:hypothetical protein [Chloroflexi bacterium CFX2]
MKITTEMLWQGALLFAILDAILLPILLWRIKPATFRQMRKELMAITAIFWCSLWFWVIRSFWETVYHYFFPEWSRWLIPFLQAGLTTLVAMLAWRLTAKARVHPVLGYCLIGGLWGVITHLWAVHRGIVEKPAMLQGALPAAAVIIAFFEFIFYWCVIIIIAVLVHTSWRGRTPDHVT